MKKIIALLLCVCLMASFAGCSSDKGGSYNINDIMAAIENAVPLASTMDMDDSWLTEIYGISLDDVEEYVGKVPLMNNRCDEILIVKAAKGKADTIKAACEARREAVASGCQTYLEDQYLKADAGRIVVKGDYVVFVIAGDNDVIVNTNPENLLEGVNKAYEPIDAAIDEALK